MTTVSIRFHVTPFDAHSRNHTVIALLGEEVSHVKVSMGFSQFRKADPKRILGFGWFGYSSFTHVGGSLVGFSKMSIHNQKLFASHLANLFQRFSVPFTVELQRIPSKYLRDSCERRMRLPEAWATIAYKHCDVCG